MEDKAIAEDGDTPDLRSQDVLEALITTAHAVRRFGELRMAHFKPQAHLSPSRMRVLRAVAREQSVRMGDLAAALGIAARTVTDLVDGLEKEGMLVRRTDPSDRRATLVELGPDMHAKWEHIQVLIGSLSEEILEPLTAGERRRLFDLLNRLKSGPIGDEGGEPPTEVGEDCTTHKSS